MTDILAQIMGPAGALVLALTILFGGFKKTPWWVFGWTYRGVVEEKDEWKRLALRGSEVTERVVSIAESRRDNEAQKD